MIFDLEVPVVCPKEAFQSPSQLPDGPKLELLLAPKCEKLSLDRSEVFAFGSTPEIHDGDQEYR